MWTNAVAPNADGGTRAAHEPVRQRGHGSRATEVGVTERRSTGTVSPRADSQPPLDFAHHRDPGPGVTSGHSGVARSEAWTTDGS